MNCPVDGETLQMAERSGVEIDYCPRCRGVWLDRGELDKIIERSASGGGPAVSHPGDHDHHHRSHKKKKRKESFLGELFDF